MELEGDLRQLGARPCPESLPQAGWAQTGLRRVVLFFLLTSLQCRREPWWPHSPTQLEGIATEQGKGQLEAGMGVWGRPGSREAALRGAEYYIKKVQFGLHKDEPSHPDQEIGALLVAKNRGSIESDAENGQQGRS